MGCFDTLLEFVDGFVEGYNESKGRSRRDK